MPFRWFFFAFFIVFWRFRCDFGDFSSSPTGRAREMCLFSATSTGPYICGLQQVPLFQFGDFFETTLYRPLFSGAKIKWATAGPVLYDRLRMHIDASTFSEPTRYQA